MSYQSGPQNPYSAGNPPPFSPGAYGAPPPPPPQQPGMPYQQPGQGWPGYPPPLPPQRRRGPIVALILIIAVLLVGAVVGGTVLFKKDDSGGKESSGAGNAALGTTIASTDKALSYQVPKDFVLEKPLVPPSYAATAHGKEGFVDTFAFSSAGVSNAAGLQRFAEAHKYLDTTASSDWKATKVDGLTAVTTVFTDADKPSFIAYILAKNGNVVRVTCFPKAGGTDAAVTEMCPSVLKTIKVGDLRTS